MILFTSKRNFFKIYIISPFESWYIFNSHAYANIKLMKVQSYSISI